MKRLRTFNPVYGAVAGLILLALIWGYNWVIMKIALRDCGPFTFSALRSMLGALALFPLLPFKGGIAAPPKAIPAIILLGLFQTAGFLGFTFWALVEGGAGKTAVLVYTMPFWVLILARLFLGERIRPLQWPAILLSFAGLSMIFEPWHARGSLFPEVLAVMAGIFWAAAVVIAKRLLKKDEIPLLQLTAWQMLFGAIPLVIVALIVPEVPINWSPSFIASLLYNVIPGNAIAWLLWLYILEKLPAGAAGMGSMAIPLVGVISARLQLGERPGPIEAAGMLLIGIALLILSVYALLANKLPKSGAGRIEGAEEG
ncbi:MAG: EamA family transporter [Geobacteraceae bacterium]|nr:EamA family transporter [Geobacteraceae bacterium]